MAGPALHKHTHTHTQAHIHTLQSASNSKRGHRKRGAKRSPLRRGTLRETREEVKTWKGNKMRWERRRDSEGESDRLDLRFGCVLFFLSADVVWFNQPQSCGIVYARQLGTRDRYRQGMGGLTEASMPGWGVGEGSSREGRRLCDTASLCRAAGRRTGKMRMGRDARQKVRETRTRAHTRTQTQTQRERYTGT